MDRFIPSRANKQAIDRMMYVPIVNFKKPAVTKFEHYMKPVKTLDAPELDSDFLGTVTDWSMHGGIAIAIDRVIYFYDYSTCTTLPLFMGKNGLSKYNSEHYSSNEYAITTVQFSTSDPVKLALGSRSQEFVIVDSCVGEAVCVKRSSHMIRKSDSLFTMEWSKLDSNLISYNSDNGTVVIYDVRDKAKAMKYNIGFNVTKIKWSPFDERKLAVGSLNGNLNVLDLRTTVTGKDSVLAKNMRVRSLEWCPYIRSNLFCGNDDSIHIYNPSNNTEVNRVHIGASVNSILFSKTTKEFVCGTNSGSIKRFNHNNNDNSSTAEKFLSTGVAMNMCSNGDGSLQIITTSGEALEIWELFRPQKKSYKVEKKKSLLVLNEIR